MRVPSRSTQAGFTLVELLVTMIIMTIVSGMIITVWFALGSASAFSSTSDQQQEFVRDAVSRMAAEIRDAQAKSDLSATAFVVATPTEIDFYTTYNTTGASNPTTTPTLVRFIWKETDPVLHIGAIYREDVASGTSTLLVSNVVNQSQNPPRDVFTYWTFNAGTGKLEPSTSTSTVDPTAIEDVTITLLVDLNPGHSPQYVTVQTTVQPRNVLQP